MGAGWEHALVGHHVAAALGDALPAVGEDVGAPCLVEDAGDAFCCIATDSSRDLLTGQIRGGVYLEVERDSGEDDDCPEEKEGEEDESCWTCCKLAMRSAGAARGGLGAAATHRMSRSWLLSGLRRLLRLAMGGADSDQAGDGRVWVGG